MYYMNGSKSFLIFDNFSKILIPKSGIFNNKRDGHTTRKACTSRKGPRKL